MPARATEISPRPRATRAVGNGPYPGRGPLLATRLVFTEPSVINFGQASPIAAGRGAAGPLSRLSQFELKEYP